MAHFPAIFAGIGLIFIGVRFLAANMKQMSGPRFRQIVAGNVRSVPRACLIGLAGGLATQSANGTAFIIVSMVSAGVLPVLQALPIVVWGAVGVTSKIVLASFDIQVWVLAATGAIGIGFYFNLQNSPRWGNPVGAVLGLCLLFIGIHFVKDAAGQLAGDPDVWHLLLLTQRWYPLGLVCGAAFGFLIQNGTTVAMIAATLAGSGLLGSDQAVLIAVGASFGAGIASYLEFANQTGEARLVALFYVGAKLLGASLMAPLLFVEHYSGTPLLRAGLAGFLSDAALQNSAADGVTQCFAALPMTLFARPILDLLRRWAPADREESLARPVYVFAAAADEPGSALDLVEREQHRLFARLPDLLTGLHEEARSPVSSRRLHAASRSVLNETAQFVRRVTQQDTGDREAARLAQCESRDDLLAGLLDGVADCAAELTVARGDKLTGSLIDGLHALLAAAVALMPPGEDADPLLIRTLAFDRTEIAERLRLDLLQRVPPAAPAIRHALVRATGLYETIVWLLRRYAATWINEAAAPAVEEAVDVKAPLLQSTAR